LGNDAIQIDAGGINVNASVRDGQGNDIFGSLTNSAIYGKWGAVIISVGDCDFSSSAVYGGESNDVITNEFGDNIECGAMLVMMPSST